MPRSLDRVVCDRGDRTTRVEGPEARRRTRAINAVKTRAPPLAATTASCHDRYLRLSGRSALLRKIRPLPKPEIKQIIVLGQRFASRRMYREAVKLLRLGVELDPDDLDVKSSLSEILQKAGAGEVRASSGSWAADDSRRDYIDASHFVGLARFYVERGDDGAALDCLEMAKTKASCLPAPYKLQGTILIRRSDFEGAAMELAKALRFDPFDGEVAEQLGRVEYERQNFTGALDATIDAFLLSRDRDPGPGNRLIRRIRTLKRILNLENQELIQMFRQRQERLTTDFDRLQWRRQRFLAEKGMLDKRIQFEGRPAHSGGKRIALAGRLRRFKLWSNVSDEGIFRLTEVVQEEARRPGSVIFVRGTEGTDLFILESGEVVLQRPTPYGTFPLRVFKPGTLFGEVNYILPSGRTGDAVTVQECELLRIGAEKLEELIATVPELGVELYSSFWQGLARKLRLTNERLRTFFPTDTVDALPQNLVPLGATPTSVSNDSVHVDPKDKIRLFREQGLSGKELMTLATFSKELKVPAGTHLFREGDQGDQMYIVLEGQVRISKVIPGAGEEALAILGRGDFFGEIALIQGQERSADAQAHGGAATVLALDQGTVAEVLTMDPHASLEFLKLLCRLLAKRLREIDGKVVAWQILSGQRSSDETSVMG